ncbi:MAG: hypothetical protein S4CHLAM2_18840 [Chlamydiales bacterium]|nr:hypothetical protein [Chlamydiales bacterium]
MGIFELGGKSRLFVVSTSTCVWFVLGCTCGFDVAQSHPLLWKCIGSGFGLFSFCAEFWNRVAFYRGLFGFFLCGSFFSSNRKVRVSIHFEAFKRESIFKSFTSSGRVCTGLGCMENCGACSSIDIAGFCLWR